MSDHDPLCPELEYGANADKDWPSACQCALIREARADERARQEDGWAARLNSTVAWAENGVRDDLIAQVEALHERLYDSRWMVDRDDVLALIDGGSDD